MKEQIFENKTLNQNSIFYACQVSFQQSAGTTVQRQVLENSCRWQQISIVLSGRLNNATILGVLILDQPDPQQTKAVSFQSIELHTRSQTRLLFYRLAATKPIEKKQLLATDSKEASHLERQDFLPQIEDLIAKCISNWKIC